MLTKIIGNMYALFLEVSLWLLLALGLIVGAEARGLIGAIIGVVAAVVLGVVVFGAFIMIIDIRRSLSNIELTVTGRENFAPVKGADDVADRRDAASKAESDGWM